MLSEGSWAAQWSFIGVSAFGGFGLLALCLGILAGIPPIYEYIKSGYTEVRRFPLAILATGLVLLSSSLVLLGLILHAVNWRFKELHNVMIRRRAQVASHGKSNRNREIDGSPTQAVMRPHLHC